MTNIIDFFYNLYNKIKNNNIFKRNENIKEKSLITSNLIKSNTNIIINNNIEIQNKYKNDDNMFNFMKCKNYDVCNTILPKIWYKYNKIEICYKCNFFFGKWRGGKGILNQINIIKCQICLEYKKGVSQPKCEHYLCIDCMRRCYYGIYETRENSIPIFPYSEEIKKQYEIEPNNIKWDTDYPLIKKYLDEVNTTYKEIFTRYKKEKYLRKCHLCRK